MFAIEGLYPVTQDHLLIIPRRHTPDFFTMTQEEKIEVLDLLGVMQRPEQSFYQTYYEGDS